MNNEIESGAETMRPKSIIYDLLGLKSVWTVNQVVEMVAGPRPIGEEQATKRLWTVKRELVRQALIDAVKTRQLVPINEDRFGKALKDFQSGEFGHGFEIEVYALAELNRGDVIRWMEKNQILEDLKQKGYQIPDEAIKLIEKVKRKDQIKSPDSEADKSGKSKKSFEGIFPAPEGTRWKDVHFNLEEGGSLKIKVKSKERTLLLDDINRYFPQNQQRDLLIRVIRSPGGVLDNQNFIKLGENAFKNRKHIVYKLNKTLRELFGVDGNPIIFDKQNESYKALFCVYSDWKPSGMSD